MAAKIEAFFHEPTYTYSYLVWDEAARDAALIDPVLDYDPAAGAISTDFAARQADFIANHRLKLRWILETHAHADHLSAARWFRERHAGAQVAIGRGITRVQARFKALFNLEADFPTDGSQFDRLLDDGDVLSLGGIDIEVLATPGHTADSMTYVIEDAAFVGDSIFMPDMGTARCDFPGGDARELHASIQRLFALPEATSLYMCHDYAPAGREYRNVTTVVEEKAQNIHVGGARSAEEFTRMRKERDEKLGTPRLLFPAVQVNIRGGALPPAEANGIAYLKIPLDQIGK